MSLGTPYALGSAANNAAASTLIIRVGTLVGSGSARGSSTGDCLVVFASVNSTAEQISSVTDSQGNTWTKQSTVSGGEYDSACFIAPNAIALTAATDTITITYSSTSGNGKNAACVGVSGIMPASPSDSAGNVTAFSASSASPSVTTGTLAEAGEIVFAWCDSGSAPGVGITWNGNFTSLVADWQAPGSNQFSGLSYYVAPSVSAVTASGTIPTAGKWEMLTVALKPVFILSGILSNTLSEGTSGTTITVSNSAGSGQNAFDEIDGVPNGATVQYDTPYATDSTLSAKLVTASGGSLASLRWSVSMGPQTGPVYARTYWAINAFPSLRNRLISYQNSQGTNCATAHINTNGTIDIRDSGGNNGLVSQSIVPIGRVWRLEIFITGGQSTGQCGFRLFISNPENPLPDEQQISNATQAFTGTPALYDFGVSVNTAQAGPLWLSQPALSSIGWIGPAGTVAGNGSILASFL
jgi:hypothetical protein